MRHRGRFCLNHFIEQYKQIICQIYILCGPMRNVRDDPIGGTMKELIGRIDDAASAAAGNKQEISTDNLKRWRTAPLSFSTDSMDIAGGTLSWKERTKD